MDGRCDSHDGNIKGLVVAWPILVPLVVGSSLHFLCFFYFFLRVLNQYYMAMKDIFCVENPYQIGFKKRKKNKNKTNTSFRFGKDRTVAIIINVSNVNTNQL